MRFFSFMPALVIVLLGFPINAQLDPRLSMKTDTLDVYKESRRKPQVISVLDMSGSMTAVTNHDEYKTDSGQSLNLKMGAIGDGRRVAFACKDGKWVKARSSYSFDGQTSDVYVALPSIYDLEYNDTTGQWNKPSLVPMTGELVESETQKPFDPEKLPLPTSSSVLGLFRSFERKGGALYLYPSYSEFVKLSTHARMTSEKYGKTIDLPIPWKIFDAKLGDTILAQSTVFDNHSSKTLKVDANEVPCAFVNDKWVIAGASGVYGGSFCNYNPDYLAWIFNGNIQTSSVAPGWKNGLPGMTRCHAVKLAMLSTWVDVQHNVIWAYRYLDESENGKDLSKANSDEGPRALRLMESMSGTIPAAIQDLIDKRPEGGTPLTHALANAYAQMMSGDVFKDAGGFNKDCTDHYVLLFTDGQATDTKATGDPMGDYGGKDVATWLGSAFTSSIKGTIDSGKTAFNIWTLAGLAAHGSHYVEKNPENEPKKFSPILITNQNGTSPSTLAPFGVAGRTGVDYKEVKNISTMTIGVGLPGDHKDPGSKKRDLLLTAGYGNEKNRVWNVNDFNPYNFEAKTGEKFFDTKNPGDLVTALREALKEMTNVTTSMAAPVAPMVGLRSGRQIYMGSFEATTTTRWKGDLFSISYAILDQGQHKEVKLMGKNGEIKGSIDASSAYWSASQLAKASNKNIYTYFGSPKAVDLGQNPHQGLNLDLTESKFKFDSSNTDLVSFIAGNNEDSKTKIKEDLDQMRADESFGDIINASPISFEYDKTFASAVGALPTGAENTRCRVIYVGTNHGFLHAIGEVTYEIKDKDGKQSYQVLAKELWRFMPKDFLRGRDEKGGYVPVLGAWHQLNHGVEHAYMIDGPMVGYLNEDGSDSGSYQVIDAKSKDVAMVIFRLGKGGRSTYALDVTDPRTPKIRWALIPDDEPLTQDGSVTPKLGLATGSVSLSRVLDKTSQTKPRFRDTVFINGGLSTDEIDKKFAESGGFSEGKIKLGRSVLALDTLTGHIYQGWDLLSHPVFKTSIGSIPASVVPVEVFKRSNMTQRAYFSDRSGGVYALGAGLTQEKKDDNPGFYTDNSDPKCWTDTGTASGNKTIRKIWQAGEGEFITTSPVPFRLRRGYPGKPLNEKVMAPQAIGVAVGTGDFWDPMDLDTSDPAPGKTEGRHTFAVLFDRNDSQGTAKTGIPMAALKNLTGGLEAGSSYVNPLTEKDGFYISLNPGKVKPKKNENDPNEKPYYGYEKVISEPLVFKDAVYFPVFDPVTASPLDCINGVTKVYRIGDVLEPTWKRDVVTNPGDYKATGEVFYFSGIAGRLTVLSGNLVGAAGNLVSQYGTASNGSGKYVEYGTAYHRGEGPRVRMQSWRIVR